MKKSLKVILCLACIVALVASLGVGAFAYTDEEIAKIASDAQRALDVQAVENIMNRHVLYHCYGEHRAEMEEIWVQEPENQATASFGQNQGFMVGYGSIWDGYVDGHDDSWLSSAKRYCQQNGIDVSGWTDDQILEVYGGVGQLLLHVTTTAIIEVAEDGQTAKGYWYSPGMIAESGQSGNTIWEAYGVDFVKEGDEWKMWHLHMFTDFMGSFYITLGGSSGEPNTSVAPTEAAAAPANDSAQGDMTEVDEFLRHDYLSSPQYSEFSKHRLRSEMEVVPVPVPYETWDFAVPNYGPTAEEWESIGVDLDAWYAAHGGAPAAPGATVTGEVTWADYQQYLVDAAGGNAPDLDEFKGQVAAIGSWDEMPMDESPWDMLFTMVGISTWDEFVANGGVGNSSSVEGAMG